MSNLSPSCCLLFGFRSSKLVGGQLEDCDLRVTSFQRQRWIHREDGGNEEGKLAQFPPALLSPLTTLTNYNNDLFPSGPPQRRKTPRDYSSSLSLHKPTGILTADTSLNLLCSTDLRRASVTHLLRGFANHTRSPSISLLLTHRDGKHHSSALGFILKEDVCIFFPVKHQN